MTNDKIIALAQEAGFEYRGGEITYCDYIATEEVFKFAQLLLAKQWISVSESLPDIDVLVLVKVGAPAVPNRIYKRVRVFDAEKWQDQSDNHIQIYDHFVTHWMHLPLAPLNTDKIEKG